MAHHVVGYSKHCQLEIEILETTLLKRTAWQMRYFEIAVQRPFDRVGSSCEFYEGDGWRQFEPPDFAESIAPFGSCTSSRQDVAFGSCGHVVYDRRHALTVAVDGIQDVDYERTPWFVACQDYLLVNRCLANHLANASLSGVSIEACETALDNLGRASESAFQILGQHPAFYRPLVLRQGVLNCCPHCGGGEIVCGVCHQPLIDCEACGLPMYFGDNSDEQVPRGCRPVSDVFERYHDHEWVLDAKKSGAHDMLGENVVSERMVELLIAIEAQPFVVQPIEAIGND